jgi:hypothetical protein
MSSIKSYIYIYFSYVLEYYSKDNDMNCQVALFLQLHRTTSSLLEEVSHWGEAHPTFDADNFRINMAEESKAGSEVEGADDVVFENPACNIALINSPDSLSQYYR